MNVEPLRPRLPDERAREILKQIEGLSALPTIARRILEILDDPKSSVDQICAVASVDPGLVTLLLRTVNSAYFGLRSRVTSIHHALVILGIDKFRPLVVASALMQKFRAVSKTVSQDFWDHAIRTAQWSKEIGRHLKMDEIDEVYICGLIHNTGQFVLAQHFKSEWREVESAVKSGAPRLKAEQDILGWTHAALGAYLFHLWKMSDAIVESASLHHHNLRRMNPKLKKHLQPPTLVVNLAAAIGDIDPKTGAYEFDGKLERLFKLYQPVLDLGSAEPHHLTDRVNAACEEIRRIFEKG